MKEEGLFSLSEVHGFGVYCSETRVTGNGFLILSPPSLLPSLVKLLMAPHAGHKVHPPSLVIHARIPEH